MADKGMILWNTSESRIEGRYDGTFHYFAPGERKRSYNESLYLHLISQLEPEGLVFCEEEKWSPEKEKKLLVSGVKNRWRHLNSILQNYRTMNKEREAAKMSAAPPTDYIIEVSQEATQLLNRLEELEKDKFEAVKAALEDPRAKELEAQFEAMNPTVKMGATGAETVARKPHPLSKEGRALRAAKMSEAVKETQTA